MYLKYIGYKHRFIGLFLLAVFLNSQLGYCSGMKPEIKRKQNYLAPVSMLKTYRSAFPNLFSNENDKAGAFVSSTDFSGRKALKEAFLNVIVLTENVDLMTIKVLDNIQRLSELHFEQPIISMADENRLIHNLCIFMKFMPEKSKEYLKAQSVLNKYVNKIKALDYSTSSPSPELRNISNYTDVAEKTSPENFIKKVFKFLKGENFIGNDLLELIEKFEGKNRFSFSKSFRKIQRQMRAINILTVISQAVLIVSIAFFSISPSVLVIATWFSFTALLVGLTILRNQKEMEAGHLMDKVLLNLATSVAKKYRISETMLPNIEKIIPGVKGQWSFFRISLSFFTISLALCLVKPVFIWSFIPLFALIYVIILHIGFSKKGIDQSQEAYQKKNGLYKKHLRLDAVYTFVKGKPSFQLVQNSFQQFKNKNLFLVSFLQILIFLVVPVPAFISGAPLYGIALSGYLKYLTDTAEPIKSMSRTIYEIKKLKNFFLTAERLKEYKWETEWRTKEGQCLLSQGYNIKSIRMNGVTLLSPDDKKCLLESQNFLIQKNKITQFAAYSGAGKSQTAKMLGFLRSPNEGTIELMVVSPNGEEKWVPAVPKNFNLDRLRRVIYYENMQTSVDENLFDLLLAASDISILKYYDLKEKCEDMEKRFRISAPTGRNLTEYKKLKSRLNHMQKKIDSIKKNFLTEAERILPEFSCEEMEQKLGSRLIQFSDGQKKRIKLLITLITRTPGASFLILDEPFSKIETQLKDMISAYLGEWQRKHEIGLIILDHNPRKQLKPDIIKTYSNGEIIDYEHLHVQAKIHEQLQLQQKPGQDFRVDDLLSIMQNVFEKAAGNYRVATSMDSPVDYKLIEHQLKQWGIKEQISPSILNYKLSTFYKKAKLLRQFNLPINSNTLRFVNVRKPDEENFEHVFVESIKRSLRTALLKKNQKKNENQQIAHLQKIMSGDPAWAAFYEFFKADQTHFKLLIEKVLAEKGLSSRLTNKMVKIIVEEMELRFGSNRTNSKKLFRSNQMSLIAA